MTLSIPFIGKHEIDLPYKELMLTLKRGFDQCEIAPLRHHHDWSDEQHRRELLIMPAWDKDHLVAKLITILPGNTAQGLPLISGVVVLLNGKTGQPLAMLDAQEITGRRTAATSALASSFLSRADSKSLLVVGTGHLVPYLIEAHLAVRQFTHIHIYGRDEQKAKKIIHAMSQAHSSAITWSVVTDLAAVTKTSDIICTATSARSPLIFGDWVSPGTHLDLVGSYRANMREVDSQVIKMSTVFVDTRDGATSEAGDILQAIEDGSIDTSHIRGEISELCNGLHHGRSASQEITVYKSVGVASQDLLAAKLAYLRYSARE